MHLVIVPAKQQKVNTSDLLRTVANVVMSHTTTNRNSKDYQLSLEGLRRDEI